MKATSVKRLEELYVNEFGKVYQDLTNHKIIVELNGEQSAFNIHCFFAFKKKIDRIDLADLITKSDASSDDQIVNPCGCDRCFVFSIMELVQLKDLLSGARVMMDLNRILYERLYNIIA